MHLLLPASSFFDFTIIDHRCIDATFTMNVLLYFRQEYCSYYNVLSDMNVFWD